MQMNPWRKIRAFAAAFSGTKKRGTDEVPRFF
jgi:hypothetical protein